MTDSTQLFRAMSPAVMQQLMSSFALADFQAGGILGNLGHECAGFTAFHQIGQPEGRGGYGWAQWTGDRRTLFFSWASNHGLDQTSTEANYGFLAEELTTTFHDSIKALKATRDLASAVTSFCTTYENPAPATANLPSRLHWAQIAMVEYAALPPQ